MSCGLNCSTCTAEKRLQEFEKSKEKYSALTSFCYNFKIHSMPTTILLGLTNRCNLACDYCFVNQNEIDMTYEIAEKSVEWALNNQKQKPEYKVSINFFGGEPLLKFDEIIKP